MSLLVYRLVHAPVMLSESEDYHDGRAKAGFDSQTESSLCEVLLFLRSPLFSLKYHSFARKCMYSCDDELYAKDVELTEFNNERC